MKPVNQAEVDRKEYEAAYNKPPVVGNSAGAKAMQMSDPVAARMVGESEVNYLSRRAAAVKKAKDDRELATLGTGPRDQREDADVESMPALKRKLHDALGLNDRYHERQKLNKLKMSGGPR